MKVTTSHLSPDATIADASFGQINRGEMAATDLEALLKRFTSIDASQNQRHDPHVIVRLRDEAHLIRTSLGQLQLYNARDVSQPGSKIDLPELMALLEGSPAAAEPAGSAESAVPEQVSLPVRRRSSDWLAVVFLVVGLGLNVWGLARFFMREGEPPPEYTPITDPTQLAELRQQVAGIYATGIDAGSRVMTIKSDDRMEFALLAKDAAGALHQIRKFNDSFVWSRRHDGTVCLVTASRGQVVLGVDARPQHFGDKYRRLAYGKQP